MNTLSFVDTLAWALLDIVLTFSALVWVETKTRSLALGIVAALATDALVWGVFAWLVRR